MHVCTIIAKNYIAFARVLARSFAAQHPDGHISVLVIDSFEGHIDPAAEPFDVLTPADIDCPEFEAMAAIYDVLELSTAVKPWLLRHLLAQSGPGGVVYLDPDIRVFAPLTELEALTRAHGLVLTPHLVTPLPRDGLRPNEPFFLSAGTYNLGFASIGPGAASERLLDWWCERLRHDCLVDPARGYFVDQRWFDLLPSIVEAFHVLRDPGYNVAYWNLHGRRIESTESGYLAGGRPLRFFHFSGFDPDCPGVLSLHQDRVDLDREPVLADLCRSYGRELHDSGFGESREWTYDYATLPDGTRLDRPLRRLLRKVELSEGIALAPFTPAGLQSLYDHLNQPASADAPAEITRLVDAIYRERIDLHHAFPEIEGEDRGAFLAWVQGPGREELSLPDALLPPWGVNVAGYLRSELGVGEAARLAITGLEAVGVPVLPVHGSFVPRSRQGHEYAHTDTASASFPVNLICVNADMLPSFAEQAGPEFFEDRYTIGMWFWEVSEFPKRWRGSFEHLDELWVASAHVADALTPVSPIPVVKTGLPVSLPDIPPLRRAELGMPEGFVFLKMFDFDSGFERKNPLGAVRAFRRAFPTPGEASLVLKSINSEHHPDRLELLLSAAAERPDIHVVDRYVSVEEKNAMIASCDCFVSLHRAEGFGIGPAEAMWLGKPVLATAYAGTLEFMSGANSFLVDNELIEIGPGNDPYPAHGVWAQPDEEHAASLMRLVVDDEGERDQRAQRAAESIRITHSPAAIGEVMQRRLEHIRGIQSVRSVERAEPADHAGRAIQVMSSGPARAGASRFGPGGDLLRRLLLRLTRPLAVYQRQVDEAIVDGLIALREEGRRAEAATTLQHADLVRQLRSQSARVDQQSARVDQLNQLTEGNAQRLDARLKRVEPERARLDRWPVEVPWTHEYVAAHRSFIANALDDAFVMNLFAQGSRLPQDFGVGLDERVVEYPWLFAQPLGGEALDAGSVLNHAHILERVEPLVTRLTIATLVSEDPVRALGMVTFEDADLRALPYEDASFDTVVCLSTLEHVGMDNTVYGSEAPRAEDPSEGSLRAAAELRRVLRPGGRLLVSVPYGAREDLGWVRTFDRREIDALVAALAPGETTVAVYRYGARGWQLSDLDEAATATYRDFTADRRPVEDNAAAARAVACIRVVGR